MLILLLGFALRANTVWLDAPLDSDEALYASFARQISHENTPLLLGEPVDKPPLSFYLTAFAFKLFTYPTDWAARLPNLIASTINLALLWQLAYRLYRSRVTAHLAMLFAALSPFAVAFAGTAFVDPQVTLWVLAAALAAVRGRWGWSGLFGGLACATKQSAVQFLPLALVLGVIAAPRRVRQSLRRWLPPLLLIALLALAWGVVRMPESAAWWSLGTANNAPGRLIRADEVIPRLEVWLSHFGHMFGSPLLIAIVPLFAVHLIGHIRSAPRRQETTYDLALLAYLIGYVLVYWLIAFNTYNRYAHTLLPVVALLTARSLQTLCQWLPGRLFRRRWIIPALLLAVMIAPAVRAVNGDSLLRPAQDRYREIDTVAAYLNTLPPGTIVYDHWLGWPLRWYLGQTRPPDMWLRVTYYPTPEALAADAAIQSDPGPRYLPVPAWVWPAPWLDALRSAGFDITTATSWKNFTVYRIERTDDPP